MQNAGMMQLEATYSNCDWCHTQPSSKLRLTQKWADWWFSVSTVYPNDELLALFYAEQTGKEWLVMEMWLPKQRVTSVECEILEHSGDANGMIHSHHSMRAVMSSQDRQALMPSYTLSVVTNHVRKVEGYERISLPCGGLGFRPLTVLLGDDLSIYAEVDAALVPDKVEAPTLTVVPTVPSFDSLLHEDDDEDDYDHEGIIHKDHYTYHCGPWCYDGEV